LPAFPEEWKPYFGPGKGGVQTSDTGRADPSCVEKAKEAPAPGPYRCSEQHGKVGMGIGPLRLGIARRDAEAALGPAARETHGVARWCTADGGKLSAGFTSDRLRFVLTTSPGFSTAGVAPGDASAGVRKRLRKFDQRGGVAVLVASSKKRLVLVGADRKRIRFIAVTPAKTSARAIRAWLDASR
jgi:hypothetical protein